MLTDDPTKLTQQVSTLATNPATSPGAAPVTTAPAAPDAAGGFGAPPAAMQSEPKSIAGYASDMMKDNSPLMEQARTRGKQYANQRGLLNSSIGAQAEQTAMLDAVLPTAQAQASLDLQRQTADREFSTNNRRAMESMVSNYMSLHQNTIANIMANSKIKGAERTSQIEAAKANLEAQLKLTENLFNIEIPWNYAG